MISFRSCTLLICGLFALPGADSLAQQVPAGFKVDLVYGVPDIEHPSAVTCDSEGNLFVGEDPMDMRGPATEPIDRIVLIRWDKDGGPPVKTVFCENLSAVFGMLWYQDALYVMNAPYYTMLKDTDGDGVADVREELCDSFGHAPGFFGLNNHVPSGMRLGMDGFVYVALGDKGLPKAIGADGSTITLEGGGVFRMRPDATQLEIVSHGIRNNMDVALDQFDNIFTFDNDDDYGWWMRVIHHVPTGYYGYPYDYRSHRNPFLPPVGEFGSGTACGGACYREAAWPAQYQGNAFFCDWGESKIERYTLTKKGASFEAQVDDFMLGDGSGDFRPIDLCFSPDGKHMYVADWNQAGGGTPDKVGRLFRVTYVGDEVPSEPARATDADPLDAQLRALAHPAHHERMRAQQRLAQYGQTAVDPIAELLKSDQRVLVRVHAIWTQNALTNELADFDPTPQWTAALRDADAEVRCQAARALGNRRVVAARADLAAALKDSAPAVRMQAAIALGRIGQADSANALYEALAEQDVVACFTIVEALRAIGNWPLALSHLRTADKPIRDGILQALAGVFDITAIDVLNQWLHEAADPTERAAALRALARVHRQADPYTGGWWGGKAAGGQPARPQEHTWAATAVVLEAIAAGLQQDSPQVRIAALDILREVPVPDALPKVRRMVTDDADQEVRLRAIQLLADVKDTEIVPSLLRLAADNAVGAPLREAALRAVVAGDATSYGQQITQIALTDDAPANLVAIALDALVYMGGDEAKQAIAKRLVDPRSLLRAKAVEAYAQVQGDDAAAHIVPLLHDPDMSVQRAALSALSVIADVADEATRYQVIKALATAPDQRALPCYLTALLDSNKETQVAACSTLVALGDSICNDLHTMHDRNELAASVRRELTKLFATNSQFDFLREVPPAKLEPAAYAEYARDHHGDQQRGQQLFANTKGIGCIKCHVVGGVGEANIGPDLLGVGARYPRRELIRSVLEPSNRILIDFEVVVVETTDGLIHQGMIRNQTPSGIELITPDGKIVSVAANEIEAQVTSNLSPMPNGLADGMTLQNFADIIAYLESLK
ncbi:MAG TPA: HEAT repeat domain-containing protein [Planctomycetaceae bacterium]|nr:HEAT repeat domain-containing protein [Planctomycetaceae bacterium]